MPCYAVIGLGYVGLGLAVALAKRHKVLGFDINTDRVNALKHHNDVNLLCTEKELCLENLILTHEIQDIASANFFIVTVPTPVCDEHPDLEPLRTCVEALSHVIKKGDIVVFESTVYPTTTQNVCVPLLERGSHLQCGHDFHVGYSPERICPGDRSKMLPDLMKVVAASDAQTLDLMVKTYSEICKGVYPVSSIEVAEACKMLENAQRDVNIALINEFTKIMHGLNIDMHDVLEAAKTKYNFVPFKPGFVGGHCISVDPYYMAYIGKKVGVSPDVILAARNVNDGMSRFVIESMFKLIVQHKLSLTSFKVAVLGLTYKENIPDRRNSLSLKLFHELQELGIDCCSHDPFSPLSTHTIDIEHFPPCSVLILAVGHDMYRKMGFEALIQQSGASLIMDIDSIFKDEGKTAPNVAYWHL